MCVVEQVYHLRSSGGFFLTDFHCPQWRLCNFFVAYYTKEYLHKTNLFASGTHSAEIRLKPTAWLSQHEKFAVTNAVLASPLATGYSVHQNLVNQGLEVGNDKSTRATVSRLVRTERCSIMFCETRR